MARPGPSRYPTAIAELSAWRAANGVTAEEARRRFVQFVVLATIGASAGLVPRLALKGGNALRFVHGSVRSTIDLDFTAEADFPDNASDIRALLDAALRLGERQHQVKARCQAIRRKPPRPEQTLPTYNVKICFQLPGDRYYRDFEARGQFSEVIELEISLNDVLCETIEYRLSPTTRPVRVCSLEDIVAEKLRALLQQTIRNRSRPQDVYDIASRVRESGPSIDVQKVSEFLIRKSWARGIRPRKSSFGEAVRGSAAVRYEEQIRAQTAEFIPFDEAWAAVLSFVGRLSIPE